MAADASLASGASSDALLRHLEWTVLKRLDGLLQGDWRTAQRGQGIDLADLREYQLHDDVRHIDWNVTARLQVPHVRQYTEDRDLTAWFLLDLSGSVDFGSGDTTKLAVSAGFVTAIARLLTRHGNRVGALLYGTHVDTVLPPGSSRLHVLNLLQRMRQPRPARAAAGATADAQRAAARASSPPPSAATPSRWRWPWSRREAAPEAAITSLADLLRTAGPLLRRRSLVFVVSDFISTPGWEEALARLAQRHDVVAVRLVDPLEDVLPDIGLVTLQDAETGEQLLVDTADPGFRERYGQIAQAREHRLREALAASGADTLELATDDDLMQALLRWCDLRRQRARLKASHRFPAAFQRATAVAPEAAPRAA